MSELEERINSVLNDPEQLARLSAMARSLMGGEDSPAEAAAPLPAGAEGPSLGALGALLKGGLEPKSRQLQALEALAPCLDAKRAAKLRRAIAAVRVFRVARAGLGAAEDGDV